MCSKTNGETLLVTSYNHAMAMHWSPLHLTEVMAVNTSVLGNVSEHSVILHDKLGNNTVTHSSSKSSKCQTLYKYLSEPTRYCIDHWGSS